MLSNFKELDMEEIGADELVGAQDDSDERHFFVRNAVVCRVENFKLLLFCHGRILYLTFPRLNSHIHPITAIVTPKIQ
jgi:hypothetical protein